MTDESPPNLRQTIAAGLAYLRESSNLTPADVDRIMRTLGFRWSPGTTTKVEEGTRKLATDEWLALHVLVFRERSIVQWISAEAPDGSTVVGTTPVDNTVLLQQEPVPDGLIPDELAVAKSNVELRAWVEDQLDRWVRAQTILTDEKPTETQQASKKATLWREAIERFWKK